MSVYRRTFFVFREGLVSIRKNWFTVFAKHVNLSCKEKNYLLNSFTYPNVNMSILYELKKLLALSDYIIKNTNPLNKKARLT